MSARDCQVLEISSRVAAALVLRLMKPRLSPVAEAAAKHERAVRRLIIDAVKKTRDAVPMGELESVLSLGHGGTGAPLYVLEETLKAWERTLLGDGVEAAPIDWFKMRAAAANTNDLPSLLSRTVGVGAGVSEVCIVGNAVSESQKLGAKEIKSVTTRDSNTAAVTFSDGTKGFFKIVGSVENERAVRIIAEELGSLDLLPGMAPRTVQGRTGLLFDFAEGGRAADLSTKVRFGADPSSSAMLDFITANGDRNANNWLIKEGKISLLDHDNLFALQTRSFLFEHVVEVEDRILAGEVKRPEWFVSPKEAIKGVDKTSVAERLREMKLPDDAIDKVISRIEKASDSDTWAELWAAR